jgi:putative ATPase
MGNFSNEPLAERMRPSTLEWYIGQTQLVGNGALLEKIIQNKLPIPSLLLWGPPGVGKTTLAYIIAKNSEAPFFALSAIQAGVKDVREIIDSASKQGRLMQKPILFIDEIHRFSKSQQDALLGAVEKGIIVLIGATTENPSFEVIPALISRCQIFVLKPLLNEELIQLLNYAITNDVLLKHKKINLKETDSLLQFAGGDARKLLNLFELAVNSALNQEEIEITNASIHEIVHQKTQLYDKSGEMHYDVISAFIKSMRGSDPNAALYYLALMLDAGEDPKFIARKMLILASEDIGNANPTALILANNCFQAVSVIGYPECDLILSQTAIYLASSAKSNAAYTAIRAAQALVKKSPNLSVPLHLRNAPTKLMKDLNYGADYQYAHQFEGNFVDLEFLPKDISGTTFYEPGNNPRENEIRNRLKNLWKEKYGY